MTSHPDLSLSPEVAEALSMLRADADAMPPTQLRRVLGRAWGKNWEGRFREFDWEPIAAASIGQVHRAVTLDGRVATVGTIEVELGQEGDLVVVADPDCDGVATPVLLRPATGEVFVFDRWSLDEPIEVPATVTVPDAVTIAEPTDPCGAVTVTDADGAALTVTPR